MKKFYNNAWLISWTILAIICCMIFFSCNTTRKNTTFKKQTLDSTVTVEKSQISINREDYLKEIKENYKWHSKTEHKDSSITEKSFDIIELDSGSVIEFKNDKDFSAVVTKPNGKKQIFVPKQKETSTQKSTELQEEQSSQDLKEKLNKVDSAGIHENTSVAVKKESVQKEKSIIKIRVPLYVYFGLGLLFILLLYRFRNKIISWFV